MYCFIRISFLVGMLFHVLALLGFSSSGYAIPCTCFIRIQFSSGYAGFISMLFHVLALLCYSMYY